MSPTAPLHILVVSPWYPSAVRPFAGTFVREHVRALKAAGHEVSVIVNEDSPTLKGPLGTTTATAEGGGLVIRSRIRPDLPQAARALARGAATRVALDRLLAAGGRPQVVHAHVFATGLYAIVLARALDAPLVITEHETAFAFGPFSLVDKYVATVAFRTADLVTTVCENLRRAIEAVGIHARFAVVPNLVDTQLFSGGPTPHDAAPWRLLAVGGLVERKGIRHALEALLYLQDDVTLDIVGDGPLRRDYEELASSLGLRDRVFWHGTQPSERVAELMRLADLYVLPSEFDNLPTVLLESLCCGLPVVATRVGGVPEIVQAGDGLLVPPRDPRALAAAIRDGLARHWDRDAIAARAGDRYGPAGIVPRWESIYGRLIEARRAPSG